jgi:hypothetical protein
MKHAWMAVALWALVACGDDTEDKTSSTSTGGTSGAGGNTSGAGGGWQDLQGDPCPSSGCPAPLQCVSYCGFAGCNDGMMFSSCEIPCGPRKPMCPDGQICVSIADGPGDVCMPE